MWFKKKDVEVKAPMRVPVDEKIVIPEPEIVTRHYTGKIENHNDFNLIIDVNGTPFRVKSDASHEVVRMKCSRRDYEFDTEVIKNGISVYYVTYTKVTEMIKRLFVTDKGNFFYQYIYFDDSCRFYYVARNDMLRDMSNIEVPAETREPFEISGGCLKSVIKPGIYENTQSLKYARDRYRWEACVDSYEIIDQDRYDQLIEVL